MEKVDKCILIVEDEEIARNVLELILQKYFTRVYTAGNGKEGLEMAEKLSPDLIIADLAMPVIDGFVMLKELEAREPVRPVLIVTAYRAEAEKCGDYRILHKPVNKKELMEAVSSNLGVSLSS
jgi:two-component system response regulator AtoC